MFIFLHKSYRPERQLNGFTLVELAIVIVIIGLIVGGVLGANSLIKSSQLNAQITQISEYNRALSAFKLEYDELPGDMPNSTASGYDLRFTNSNTQGGSNKIESQNGDIPAIHYSYEPNYFFLQLADAELIRESLANTWPGPLIGRDQSIPPARIGFGGISVSTDEQGDISWFLMINTGHSGGGVTYRDQLVLDSIGGILSTKQAYTLDKKLDDGHPRTGNVRITSFSGSDVRTTGTVSAQESDCVNSSSGYAISYQLSNHLRNTL